MKRSHWLLMLLCCLIPLAGIVAILVFGIPTTSVLYFALVLLCPILHFVMMRDMAHDHRHGSGAPVGPRKSSGDAAVNGRDDLVKAEPRP
ncbi:MAG TPA: DUF2933 domain-containing protein [Anaerolineales bacterium]|nr:DUF2933 domain-containing protein [Anaerolineales bacterium]